ncbi:hypothetical protein C9J01_11895 [Photobacterium rosenbergii]|uniref:Uncharacterized protein n=1 Tax=Photobacterium rosenbergii TaxID=294936 RepID=A0A2T3NG24_9GAMM|nr:hypothetical protein C9J01_11895 [Photobacterium rosenbergii]
MKILTLEIIFSQKHKCTQYNHLINKFPDSLSHFAAILFLSRSHPVLEVFTKLYLGSQSFNGTLTEFEIVDKSIIDELSSDFRVG